MLISIIRDRSYTVLNPFETWKMRVVNWEWLRRFHFLFFFLFRLKTNMDPKSIQPKLAKVFSCLFETLYFVIELNAQQIAKLFFEIGVLLY